MRLLIDAILYHFRLYKIIYSIKLYNTKIHQDTIGYKKCCFGAEKAG